MEESHKISILRIKPARAGWSVHEKVAQKGWALWSGRTMEGSNVVVNGNKIVLCTPSGSLGKLRWKLSKMA